MKNSGEEYWVYLVESKKNQKMNEADILPLLVPEGPKFMLMKSDQTGEWQKPSYFGFCNQGEQRDLKRKKNILQAPELATNSPCDSCQPAISETTSPDKHDHQSVPAVCGKSYESMPLCDLGPAIAKLHQEAKQCSASIRKVAENALEFALEAGKGLLAAKEKVPHGEWGPWVHEHVPGLSSDQAIRYMQLARNFPHVRNFDQIQTIRQAYLAVGIMKEPGKKGRKKPSSPVLRDTALRPADFGSRFRSWREFIEQVKPRLLARDMPSEEGVPMVKEVEVILSLLREILEHLGKRLVTPPSPPSSSPTAALTATLPSSPTVTLPLPEPLPPPAS
ncbi:MAG: DUF3102 domain-containing protein [Verrucomicrobiae bacterium]